MKYLLLTLVAAGLCGFASAESAKTPLFNGKDLSGWTAVLDYDVLGPYAATEPTWFVTNGTIRSTGTPFGYLRTKRMDYRDYTIHVEYRWWRETPRPNSGVFVRLEKDTGAFAPTCLENQLCRGMAGDVLTLGGAVFAGFEPRSAYTPADPLSGIRRSPKHHPDSEKPFGEWNTMEVTVKGDTLVNRLNGVEQNRVTGIAAKSGAIALQSEGGAVEFRNIWIQEAE